MKKRIPPVISQILVANKLFIKPDGYPEYAGNAKNTVLNQIQFFEKNSNYDMHAKFWELNENNLKHLVEDDLIDVFDTIYQSLDGYKSFHDLNFISLPESYHVVWNVIRFQGEIACEGLSCAIYNYAVANENQSEFSDILNAYKVLGFNHFDDVFEQAKPSISKYRQLFDEISEADYGLSFIQGFWDEVDDNIEVSDEQWELIDGDAIWDALEDFIKQKDKFLEITE